MSDEFNIDIEQNIIDFQVNINGVSAIKVDVNNNPTEIGVNLEYEPVLIDINLEQTVDQIDVFLGDSIMIYQEQDRAMAAESALSASIVSETNRAKGIENSLSSQLITLQLSVMNAGNGNTNYVDSISAKLDQEILNRITNDTDLSAQVYSLSGKEQSHFNFLSAGLNAETISRIASDNTLSTRIDSVSSNLNTEITNRIAGDNALGTRIDTLSVLESNHYQVLNNKTDTLSGNLNAETANRIISYNTLSTRIDTLSVLESNHFTFLSANIGSNSSRISTLSGSLNNEIANRISGDNVLGSRIDSLSSLEALHYNTLQTKTDTISGDLNAEIANRISGDNTLNTRIDGLSVLESNHYQYLNTKTDSLSVELYSLSAKEQSHFELLSDELNDETANRIDGDSFLSTRIDTLSTLESNHYQSLITKTDTLSGLMNDETVNRIDGDNVLSTRIDTLSVLEDSHFNYLQTKTDSLSVNLYAISAKEESHFDYLQTKTDTLSSQIIAHEIEDDSIHNDLYSKIFSLSAEDQLTFDFFQTKTDTISANLNAEIDRSIFLDSVHSSRIETLSSSLASLSSLEAVHYTHLINQTEALSGGLMALSDEVDTLSDSLNDETANRIDGDNVLSTRIDTLSVLEDSHFNFLQTKTDTISGDLIVEISNRISGDNTLNDSITDETNRALDAENVITSNVLALSSEFIAHKSEDDSIHNDLYSKVFSLSSNQESNFDFLQTKTDTISASLNDEISRSEFIDSVHSIRIETLSSSLGSVSSQIASLSSLEAIHYTQLTNQTGSLSGSLMTLESELDTAFSLSGANISFNGTNLTIPSQTLSLSSSIVTRQLGDARYVDFASNQTIAGEKLFSNPIKNKGSSTPGVWMEGSGISDKGAYMVLHNNSLQFQRRATNFGDFESNLVTLSLSAPNGSMTMDSAGVINLIQPVQIQHVNPGVWLDETGTATPKGCFIVLDGGFLRFQRRATDFGTLEGTICSFSNSAPVNSLTVNTAGTVTIPEGLIGVTDGSNANAGCVGETVGASVVIASAVPLANNTSENVTSLTLGSGDWEVSGNITINYGSATVTQMTGGINSTSNTLPSSNSYVQSGLRLTTTSFTNSVTLPPKRFSSSASFTVYLVAHTVFSAGTAAAFGQIYARRIR